MAPLPFQRLAPLGLAAGLLLSGGVLTACAAAASAASDGGASTASTAVTLTAARSGAAQRQAAFQSDLKSALDGLVKQGTLNATQEQAVVTALAQRPAGNFRRGSGTASGSSSNTATARSSSVSGGRGAAQRTGAQQAFEQRALDPLVQQGTLTAAQETAVLQAIQQAMPARRPAGAPTPQRSSNGQG